MRVQFEPLRIRCRPAAFVWYDRWLMIDSVLAHGWMLRQYGEDFYALPTITRVTPAVDLIVPDLPLARRADDTTHWYWAASWCDVEAATLSTARSAWVRGYPTHDAAAYMAHSERKSERSVNSVAGPDKLYNVPLYVRVVDELCWYAYGDLEQVAALLSFVPHIGKKCASGWGALLPYADGQMWQVEPWAEDWSERGPDGRRTRGVPVATLPEPDWFSGEPVELSLQARQYGYRPPYFARANQALCNLPEGGYGG